MLHWIRLEYIWVYVLSIGHIQLNFNLTYMLHWIRLEYIWVYVLSIGHIQLNFNLTYMLHWIRLENIYIYIYIYIERERERSKREADRYFKSTLNTHTYIFVNVYECRYLQKYIYIYI